jgi:hypothetical protein
MENLQKYLSELGVGTGLHYPIPLHLQKAYTELGYRRGDLPVTEKVAHEALSLPFYPELTSEEMREVQEQIKNFTVEPNKMKLKKLMVKILGLQHPHEKVVESAAATTPAFSRETENLNVVLWT